MLNEYKIQKVVDGNKDESFKIFVYKVSSKKFWRQKVWENLTRSGPDRYGVKDFYTTLAEAQNVIKMQMEADAVQEFNWNKNNITVLKEYSYTEIPNHVPEEQHEKFCDLSEVKV